MMILMDPDTNQTKSKHLRGRGCYPETNRTSLHTSKQPNMAIMGPLSWLKVWIGCLLLLTAVEATLAPTTTSRSSSSLISTRTFRSSPSSMSPTLAVQTDNVPRGGAAVTISRDKKKKPVMDMTKAPVPRGKISVGRLLEIHKALWLPLPLYMLLSTDTITDRGAIMAGMFGGYGIIWVLKSYAFWDKTFYNDPSMHVGLVGVVTNAILIATYLSFPAVASNNIYSMTTWEMVVSILLFTVGIFFHHGSDAQKFFTLKYRGKGLITEGLFAKCRAPNYFGEILIWTAFTIVAGCTQKLLILPNLFLGLMMVAFGIQKDRRFAKKYPEFAEWKKKTWLLVPKPW